MTCINSPSQRYSGQDTWSREARRFVALAEEKNLFTVPEELLLSDIYDLRIHIQRLQHHPRRHIWSIDKFLRTHGRRALVRLAPSRKSC